MKGNWNKGVFPHVRCLAAGLRYLSGCNFRKVSDGARFYHIHSNCPHHHDGRNNDFDALFLQEKSKRFRHGGNEAKQNAPTKAHWQRLIV
jgi:hypothetical protein